MLHTTIQRNDLIIKGGYILGKLLRNALNNKKVFLINKLIEEGVYKKNNTHLFEMTLSDLQEEYNKISDKKKMSV